IQEMEEFLKTHFSSVRPVGFGDVFTGPNNNQKPFKGSGVEFCSPDLVKSLLSRVQASTADFENGGNVVLMKPARTQKQKTRNCALRKAERLTRESVASSGKTVETLWKVDGSRERRVVVNKEAAFKQC
ncbi:unnamed protein product, partial [Prorocentrum cordatum]